MASAPEGKTLAMSTKYCGICNNNVSYKYCSECCLMLCRSCTDGHRVIPATKHHTVSDISASGKFHIGNAVYDQRGKCLKHNEHLLDYQCQRCFQIICDFCLSDHSGHDIKPLKNDPKIYHKLCSKQIQQLLDELEDANDMKSILESNITTYDEAEKLVDQWEIDLLQMVKTKASRLRQKLKKVKDEESKVLLSDNMNKLMNELKEINKTITKLNEIRQGIDFKVLTSELAKSQALITKLQSFKAEINPIPTKVDVNTILPHSGNISNLETDIEVLFTTADIPSKTSTKAPTISKTSQCLKPQPLSPATCLTVMSGQEIGIKMTPGTRVVRGADYCDGDKHGPPTMSGQEMGIKMTPGTRVVRGADWCDGDKHGPPTMIGTVTKGLYGAGWVMANWDHGREHPYRMGYKGKYDLKLA